MATAVTAALERPFPRGGRIALSSHRTLRLKTGSVAVLADRNTGWCLMDEGAYQELVRWFGASGRAASSVTTRVQPLLDQLWNAGLMTANGSAHPDTFARRSEHPSSLLLKLTGACNLECTYCYDYDTQRFKARMELDRAKETISYLLERRNDLSLVFHGGEPLLRFDLLKRIVESALDIAGSRSRLRFSIQTNGTILTPEIVSFLEDNRFSVGISLDGIDDQSNALRVYGDGKTGSLVRIRKLIGQYRDFVKNRCGFLAVASKTSAPRLPDFAMWLQSEDIKSLTITFLDLVGRGADCGSEKLPPWEAVDLHEQFLNLVRAGRIEALALRSLISRIDNLFTFQPGDFCHKGPCAASGDFLVLDAEGGLRTCDCIYHPYFELAGPSEKLVNISNHPARDAIGVRHEWLREQGADCRTCALFGLCGGTCVAKAIANHATPLSVDPIDCAITRFLYPALLEEFDSDAPRPLLDYYQRHRSPATPAHLQ